MQLEEELGGNRRLEMLNRKRSATLDEIHFREMRLERVDYLRHKIQIRNF